MKLYEWIGLKSVLAFGDLMTGKLHRLKILGKCRKLNNLDFDWDKYIAFVRHACILASGLFELEKLTNGSSTIVKGTLAHGSDSIVGN